MKAKTEEMSVTTLQRVVYASFSGGKQCFQRINLKNTPQGALALSNVVDINFSTCFRARARAEFTWPIPVATQQLTNSIQ